MANVRLIVVSLGFAFVATSCGSKVSQKYIKEYRAVLVGDASFKPQLKALIDDYNANAGFRAVEFVDSPDQANSRIVISEGLERRDGKVGWGQWFSSTERNNDGALSGSVDQTTSYSFKVEFDADFLRENNKTVNGVPSYETQKLFAHEVGHGFQLDHNPDPMDVMYYDIAGTKSFPGYWAKINNHFR